MKKILTLFVGVLAVSALMLTGCNDKGPDGPKKYSLEVTAGNGGAVVVKIDGKAVDNTSKVEAGKTVKLEAQPEEGNDLIQWDVLAGEGVSITAGGTFAMPAQAVKIKAVFGPARNDIVVNGGTANAEFAAEGETVTLTLGAVAAGYKFVMWVADNDEVLIENNTFTMPDGDIEITALLMAKPTEPLLLYYDEEHGNIALGTWMTQVKKNNILYTKFGSITAFTGVASPFVNTEVKFNPVAMPADADPLDWPEYEDITYYKASDWNTYKNVAEFHVDANLIKGGGDICRLVGLSSRAARQLNAAGKLDEYDSGFRLMTKEDATEIYGTGIPPGRMIIYFEQGGTGIYNRPSDPILGVGFTLADNPNLSETFIPANGSRSETTVPGWKILEGTYWTSTPIEDRPGRGYVVAAGHIPGICNETMTFPNEIGRGIRCIRNTAP